MSSQDRIPRQSLASSDQILLFLDFDGVLHPAGVNTPHFVNLPRLEHVLRSAPGVRVVISSSWQDAYPIRVLKRYFSEDIAARIVGGTRVADCDGEERTRYEEIVGYLLRRHHPSANWLALDDAEHQFPEQCPQLVLCEPTRGFDAVAEARLGRILSLGPTQVSREMMR